jgi:phosphoglycolate phosphatase-like HAD superfamily hydrolase
MLAGKEVGAKCFGVLWGYGSSIELKKVGADLLVQDTQETLDYIEMLLL